jgi:hypothetical protein
MLNRQSILDATDNGLEVFRRFVPGEWTVGRNFRNPFYEDTQPSCRVYRDKKTGIYKIHDFGDVRYSGDCFALVGIIYELDCRDKEDFRRILQIIADEMNLKPPPGPLPQRGSKNSNPQVAINSAGQNSIPANGKTSVIAPVFTDELEEAAISQTGFFTPDELVFWQRSGITPEVLEKFRVVSISSFTARRKDGKTYTVRRKPDQPIFGYCHPPFVKVYRPFARQRFLYLGKKPDEYVFGLEQLPPRGDVLFVTGGEKDVMSLAAHGFAAVCFNSETAHIPPPVIKQLSHRFKHIILLYDTDETGLATSHTQAERLKALEVKRLVLPLPGSAEAKDISDFFRLGHTAEELKELVTGMLTRLYAETFAMLKPCEIDFAHPPPVPEPLVSINGVTIGSPGNLLGITGGEGTGKSNFLGLVLEHCLKPHASGEAKSGLWVKPNDPGNALLYYDTEQSEDQLYRNLHSVMRRCGLEKPPRWLHAYCLTHLSRQDRLRAIVQSLDKFYHQYGGIHLAVIDGIGDLIRSLNDEGESVALVEELHRLAGIYRTCVVCVLHLVPSGVKLRGHLGSELQRKSAGILCVDKDAETDVSCVRALKVRSGSPLDVPLLQFAWDKAKGHHVFTGVKAATDAKTSKREDLRLLAEELFAESESLTYTGLMNAIAEAMEVTTRTAKNYIRFMLAHKIVAKHPVTEHFRLAQTAFAANGVWER